MEVLTDSDVWEITEETAPTYNEKGSVVYHSIYGDVTLETAKKVAPYDNKTYSSFHMTLMMMKAVIKWCN